MPNYRMYIKQNSKKKTKTKHLHICPALRLILCIGQSFKHSLTGEIFILDSPAI
jgi:hypothetical protein